MIDNSNLKIKMKVMEGNEAVAYVAYRVTEYSAIYPITPSTTMGELADQWSCEGVKNIWGTVPKVIEMQSEGGAIGALHGALQTGALATTYTASQGLLLMIPNMYKIAGELLPTVIHVASRTVATHSLSIFGDHSDVMGVRETGFAMLASGSVQEAHDMALIAHAVTLRSRVPFLHFFEGFRVSHEINKIQLLSENTIRKMIDEDLVLSHRNRALNPNHPVLRGTAQNPDIYFQSREAANIFYDRVPAIVEEYMERLGRLTGRHYHVMEYYGAEKATQIIVIIGSGAKTVRQVVKELNRNENKFGVIQVYLYRPFDKKTFLSILPDTVEVITILDRTKESGSVGEPLYQDVTSVLTEAFISAKIKKLPKILGGRYGLSSKEFTPMMVNGIFDNAIINDSKNHFSVGINDDVTGNSIDYRLDFKLNITDQSRAIFYGLGSDGTVGANKNTIKIIGQETDLYAQGYFVYDSKKSGSKTVSHLRFSKNPIESPYLLTEADFIGCHQFNFVNSSTFLDIAACGATFLLNAPFSKEEIWQHLPKIIVQKIIDKKLKFYIIDAYKVAAAAKMGNRINTIMQTCFFAISGILPRDEAISKIKETIKNTYHKKGSEVVERNFAAVDKTLENLFEVPLIDKIPDEAYELEIFRVVSEDPVVQNVVVELINEKGENLPVSSLPVDGTYPTGTTCLEKRNVSQLVSVWNSDKCIQCGQCSVVCPHGVIRSKLFEEKDLINAPISFKTVPCKIKEFNDKRFHLQVYLEDCTGCGLCHAVCPAVDRDNPDKKAINLELKAPILVDERKNIKFFESNNYLNQGLIAGNNAREIQYLKPYFEFSGACAGCGETPYLKLISQLFGDRMLVANATGCSSIYGGNLPTTPWSKDQNGRGPAWCNSLFEDNAEFGYGFRSSIDKQKDLAVELLKKLASEVGEELVERILNKLDQSDEKSINEQRCNLNELQNRLMTLENYQAKHLATVAHNLLVKSVWIVGGDGWAYDIGYGGLDHILASDLNVNVLVLDTEVYSNTGGQASKSTPRGAIAKFASFGKGLARKDLGMNAVNYGSVYVAQISIGANMLQAIKAIKEAEAYPGPSLIIAYSHCIAHGFNLNNGLNQQRLAVNSGFWPLYRYNPLRKEENLNAMQIDSKDPSVSLKDYVYNEQRFKLLLSQDPERARLLLEQLELDVKQRWDKLKAVI